MVEKEGQALSVSGEVREESPLLVAALWLGPLRERGAPDRPGHVSRGQRSPRAPSWPLGRSHPRNALEGQRRHLSSKESHSLGLERGSASPAGPASALSRPSLAAGAKGQPRLCLPLSSRVPYRSLGPLPQGTQPHTEEDREGSPDCGVENGVLERPWGMDFSPDGRMRSGISPRGQCSVPSCLN